MILSIVCAVNSQMISSQHSTKAVIRIFFHDSCLLFHTFHVRSSFSFIHSVCLWCLEYLSNKIYHSILKLTKMERVAMDQPICRNETTRCTLDFNFLFMFKFVSLSIDITTVKTWNKLNENYMMFSARSSSRVFKKNTLNFFDFILS